MEGGGREKNSSRLAMPFASTLEGITVTATATNTGMGLAVRSGALAWTEKQIGQGMPEFRETASGWTCTASTEAKTRKSKRQNLVIQRCWTAPNWILFLTLRSPKGYTAAVDARVTSLLPGRSTCSAAIWVSIDCSKTLPGFAPFQKPGAVCPLEKPVVLCATK